MHKIIQNQIERYICQSVSEKKNRDGKPFNATFLTIENIQWFLFVSMNFIPNENKRLIFLPCAGGHKTRGKKRLTTSGEIHFDHRKFISESTSHQFMKAIRDDPENEKIILSEPLTLIPYDRSNEMWESHPLRPDYNLPVECLSVQGEFIFIERLALYLSKLKQIQKWREYIYYFGGAHHFFILHFANKLAGMPFEIIFKVPERGTIDYTKDSNQFMEEIREMERSGIYNIPKPLSLEGELHKRTGRYTHKPFLLALIEAERLGSSKSEIKETRYDVCRRNAFVSGFSEIYSEILKGESK